MRVLLLLSVVFATIISRASDRRTDLAPFLAPHLERTQFPALAAAVVRGTNIVAAGVVGVRKKGSEAKVTLEDKFHIGSCTKSMTALLAAFLREEGVIHFTNRVTDLLGDWKIPDAVRGITLELLLQNRSGLGNDPSEQVWRRSLLNSSATPKAQRRRFLEEFLQAPLAAEPGATLIYSNPGYSLAGAMLETAAKRNWEELIREKIFSRLGLSSGGFGPPSPSGDLEQPSGHHWKNGEPVPAAPGDNPTAIAPAGAVHLSILDSARYAAFHLAAARGRITQLRSHRTALYEAPEKTSYAMGWIVRERSWAGGKALTHGGSNTMFYTVIWLAPAKDFALVVATNVGDRENRVAQACDQVVGELIARYIQQP